MIFPLTSMLLAQRESYATKHFKLKQSSFTHKNVHTLTDMTID